MGGSSKSQTVGYKIYLGKHLVFCHGPVDRITDIKVDGRVAWQGSSPGGRININADKLFGGEKREGGVSGPVDFETGSVDQPRNSYLVEQLGANIPAFRGVAALVLRQVYLGMNPYLKKWSARMQRIYSRSGGLVQWRPDLAAIPLRISYNNSDEAFESEDFTDTGAFTTNAPEDYELIDGALTNTTTVSTTPDSYYERDLVRRAPLRRLEFDIKVVDPQPADPMRVNLVGEDGETWFVFNARRELATDPLQRPSFFHKGGANVFNPVGTEALTSGVWFTVSVEFDLALNTATLEIRNKETNSLFSSITIGVNSFSLPRTLRFVRDNDVAAKPIILHDNFKFYSFSIMDMNPAHIIRECLTDLDWGMGYQESDIDEDSFLYAAQTMFTEGMGISLVWDKQVRIFEFVNEILRHIDASLYVDRSTGKFVIKLIRDDYDLEDLLVLDEESIESVPDYKRPAPGELINAVTVVFWDSRNGKDATVSWADTALVQVQGSVNGTTLRFPGFTNHNIATRVCQRSLKATSNAILSATINCTRKAASLNIGDAFKFYWSDYHDEYIVMRVTGMTLGDGRKNAVKITCVEDLFALPETVVITAPEDDWQDPSQPPLPVEHQILVEAPYYELVQRLGQTNADEQLALNPEAGTFLVTAARPEFAINATVSVDAGGGYEDGAVVDFCPTAILVEEISYLTTEFEVEDLDDLESVVVGEHIQIGEELMRVDSIVDTTITVGRGCLDTVPARHYPGDRIFAWDRYAETDGVEYTLGEEVDVKLLPVSGAGAVELDEATPQTLEFMARAIRPYPPGNFRINSSAYPDSIPEDVSTTFTWSHRDRLQQTAGVILDTTAGDVGPEDGTSYSLQIVDNPGGSVLVSQTGITGTSTTVDTTALASGSVIVELWSVRDGLASWQKHTHPVIVEGIPTEYIVAFTATGDFTWNVPVGVTEVDVLLVGGGGGGASDLGAAGGAGAGGVLWETGFAVSGTIHGHVGVGGTGKSAGSSGSGGAGADTTFSTLTAIKGGRAGATPPVSGGSGAGGNGVSGGQAGAAGTSGQGNSGGTSHFATSTNTNAGGGGGAGANGANGASNLPGAGGTGVDMTAVFGTTYGASGWFGGGGGGASSSSSATNAAGGAGGGGRGGVRVAGGNADGLNGVANTGGGGGSGQRSVNSNAVGGNGGSGIVLIRYYL